ncbi:MAG: DUF433 domain-containing protein, partial [Candidatus Methylacidiphilales bacterium]
HTPSLYSFTMITLDHSPVHSDPEILGGTLVFQGTRVMAQSLLEYIDACDSIDEFLEQFPSVKREDAEEFLKLVREESHS